MTIKVKRLLDTARLPEKAHAGDLGYDLFAAYGADIPAGETKLVATGIAIQFPDGFGGFIKDRSSMAMHRKLVTVAGVIDNGYVGEIGVLMVNNTDKEIFIQSGEKIAQLVLIPTVNFAVVEVESIVAADKRGSGGFGSTGW